jgi:hypothetical protein
MAHVRQSRPDSGLGFEVKVLKTLQVVPSTLASGLGIKNVQRLRGGLVFKAHRLCVSLNSRLESNEEEKKVPRGTLQTRRSADLRGTPLQQACGSGVPLIIDDKVDSDQKVVN